MAVELEAEEIRRRAETGRRLKAGIGTLSTAILTRLDQRLPWYRAMPPADRSWVGLVAQSGISSFVEWYRTPSMPIRMVSEIFRAAPRELVRSISLTQTLQLLRVVVEVVEERVPDLARPGEQADLREAVLRFSREVAFAGADVYARAAEARGTWDARLEAMVIDALVRGDAGPELSTRSAALGWRSEGPVAVLLGQAPQRASRSVEQIREKAGAWAEDCLVGIHDDRLLIVLGGCKDFRVAGEQLGELFGPAPVVLGPQVATLAEAGASARAAQSALRAVAAWPGAPRPVRAEDLLPERALAGDEPARRTLIAEVYHPLAQAGGNLLETVSQYLDCGNSLEATAKAMYVHPNTVRYRLRKVAEVIPYDPTRPRPAFVLRCALVFGRLAAQAPAGELSSSHNPSPGAW